MSSNPAMAERVRILLGSNLAIKSDNLVQILWYLHQSPFIEPAASVVASNMNMRILLGSNLAIKSDNLVQILWYLHQSPFIEPAASVVASNMNIRSRVQIPQAR